MSVGQISIEEFKEPMALTQSALAERGAAQARQRTLQRARTVTDLTAPILARVFGNSADFWFDLQGSRNLFEVTHPPREYEQNGRTRAPIVAN